MAATNERTAEIWSQGHKYWSSEDFAVSAPELQNYLAALTDSPDCVLQHAADLYLACACSLARASAIAQFESRHEQDFGHALSRMRLPESMCDDVKQEVHSKLFVGNENGPMIAQYAGRGPLAGWLRAVTVRTAIDLLRKEKSQEVQVEQTLLERFASADIGIEAQNLKKKYQRLANEAFETGFRSLSSRERNLLRQHYLQHMNIDQIGALYKVHRTTAFRWITSARATIFANAQTHVAAELGEGSGEDAEELLRILESQIDVTLDRLLRSY